MSEKYAAIRALQTLRGYIGHEQLQAIGDVCQSEERYAMFDKLIEYEARVQTMPKTYEQDGRGDEAIAYLHYFRGGMDWYITEKDMEREQLQAFGLADLGMGFPETGYISIAELIEHNVELDLQFVPQTIGKIKDSLRAASRLDDALAHLSEPQSRAEGPSLQDQRSRQVSKLNLQPGS